MGEVTNPSTFKQNKMARTSNPRQIKTMPLKTTPSDVPFTNIEFNQLPERAQDYIRGLEQCAVCLKQARDLVLDTQSRSNDRLLEAVNMLTSDDCSNAIDGFQLRQVTPDRLFMD